MTLTREREYALAAVQCRQRDGGMQDPARFLPRLDPWRFVSLVFRRSWLILLCGLFVAGITWHVLSRLPKTYQASGSVYVSASAPVVLDIRAVAPEESRDLEQLRSVEQGMASSGLLLRLIDRLELAKSAGFAPGGSSRQELLGLLSGRIKVELRRGTRIIDIAVEDTDPERAKLLVESLVDEHQNWTSERQQGLTREVSEGLRREEEALRSRMEESAARLQRFREDHPVPGIEDRKGSGLAPDELDSLTDNFTRAKGERLRLEAQLDAFRKFDPALPDAVAGLAQGERTTEVLALVRAIHAKEVEFGRIKERYLEKHPAFIEATNELGQLRGNLTQMVRSAGAALEKDLRVAMDNERKLQAEVDAARGTVVTTQGLRARFEALAREAAADREIHESVAKRLRETTLAAGVPASILRWQDAPLVPERPCKPRKKILVPFAGVMGMFLGLVLVIGLELGDGRVRDIASAARAAKVPPLASLPRHVPGGDWVLVSQPASPAADVFRCLRAALTPPVGAKGTQTILFTSVHAGEGISYCAMNFAAALALQGHRTLLIDADLRNAGLSRGHLGGGGVENCGLGDYLEGNGDPAKACHPTPLEGLYLLSSGPVRADAAELLSRTRFPVLLEEAGRWFDRIVIDTPAVMEVTDALAVARYADRTCLVVGDRGCRQRDLRQAADLLRNSGANLVGFVWNTPPPGSSAGSANSPAMPVARSMLVATADTGGAVGVAAKPPSG